MVIFTPLHTSGGVAGLSLLPQENMNKAKMADLKTPDVN
jgi:hypothetical protein